MSTRAQREKRRRWMREFVNRQHYASTLYNVRWRLTESGRSCGTVTVQTSRDLVHWQEASFPAISMSVLARSSYKVPLLF